jgi:hypothetical protein
MFSFIFTSQSSERFAQQIVKALDDLKQLFEHATANKKVANGATK